MRRRYYGSSDAVDQMQHANRSLPIQMSPPLGERTRNCPLSQPQRRASPQQDSEPEKGGSHARKRIGVAVAKLLVLTKNCRDADTLNSAHDAVEEKLSAVATWELACV